ncbi:hypothetical protein [Streptomyces sp. NPDC026589]|uniref:hypothetical protein n=1 Tax=Streptomyces sp. NPDC026589 TaxID=3155609 RepID=UPI0033F7A087
MDTHAVQGAAHQATGHYRRPGTRTLYCGRPTGPRNDPFRTVRGWKLCRPCVKAEARDRAEAAAVAADHTEEAAHARAIASADRYIARTAPAVARFLAEDRARRPAPAPAPTYIYGAQQLTIIGTPRPAQGALFAAH